MQITSVVPTMVAFVKVGAFDYIRVSPTHWIEFEYIDEQEQYANDVSDAAQLEEMYREFLAK